MAHLEVLCSSDMAAAREAFDYVMAAIEHQGSVYPATKPVVELLVRWIEAGRISLEGPRNRLRSALTGPPLERYVPKASRDSISTKKTPLDGVVGFPPAAFTTYKRGVRHGESVATFLDRALGAQVTEYTTHQDGKPHGPYRKVLVAGPTLLEGSFTSGVRTGAWIERWPSGVTKAVGTYQAGKMSGDWVHHDQAGRVIARGAYKSDRRHGEWVDAAGTRTTWRNGAQV
ncbi:MAG: hypothetical protein KBG28_30960 [Kofleriaceae bacterium]|nr:hypothetical protein [Kofleriaceae bacterium]